MLGYVDEITNGKDQATLNSAKEASQSGVHIWSEEETYRFVCQCCQVGELTEEQMAQVISLLKGGL